MIKPPPAHMSGSKKHKIAFLLIGVVLLIVLLSAAALGIRFISKSGLTEPMDRKFGDQNLKSTVAMLELHKLRFGQYPDALKDIKYTGDWDQIWLNGTRYYPSEDRMTYYIEVERGWIGKPTIKMPQEFWQNTGYDERLRPKE